MVFLGKFDKLIHKQYLVPGKYEYANKFCLFLKRGCLVKERVLAEKETLFLLEVYSKYTENQ